MKNCSDESVQRSTTDVVDTADNTPHTSFEEVFVKGGRDGVRTRDNSTMVAIKPERDMNRSGREHNRRRTDANGGGHDEARTPDIRRRTDERRGGKVRRAQ